MEENQVPEKLDQVVKVICNACGADMAYSPLKQALHCEHCGNTRDLPEHCNSNPEQSISDGIQHRGIDDPGNRIANQHQTEQKTRCWDVFGAPLMYCNINKSVN